MEDYDKFVQRLVSRLSKNNDGNKPSSEPSVIRFYGHPILPPLLTEERRAEMRQHREEEKVKHAARLAHLQERLPQQPLCQAPALEGTLQESESDEESPSSQDGSGGSVLHNGPLAAAKAVFFFSPPPEETEKDESPQPLVPSPSGGEGSGGAWAPPLAVTPQSAFYAAPRPEKDGRLFGSPDGACDAGGVFQHGPSDTVAAMPEIICYPPWDGDELEGSGLESRFGRGFVISQGVSRSLGASDPSGDEDGGPLLHSPASQGSPSSASVVSSHRGHDGDRAKPRCVNLQALLRRSQEYRRHQQLLRSKGETRQIQEKNGVQTDEQSRSAKKNSELPHKRAETANEGTSNEKKGAFLPAEEARGSGEKYKMAEGPFVCNVTGFKSENTPGQGDGGDQEGGHNQEETATENDPGNVWREVRAKPKRSSSVPRQAGRGSRKLRMTRAATFSQSPVYWERTMGQDGAPEHGAGGAGPKAAHPASSSEQIDLIESSLSALRAQILDLESTLKDHSPTESDAQAGEPRGAPVLEGGERVLVRTLNTEEAALNVANEEEALPGRDAPPEAQQEQLPEVFQNTSPGTKVPSTCLVFAHASDQPEEEEEEEEAPVGCQHRGRPSDLRFPPGSGSGLASEGRPCLEIRLPPERGDEFHGGCWGIKRRRAKTQVDGNGSEDDGGRDPAPGGKTWTFAAQGCQKGGQKQPTARRPEGAGGERERGEQVQKAGVSRSLQQEQSRHQEEPLQPGRAPPERLRPLLAAAAKGFLTRRLLRTERVEKLVDVVRDMQQLLNNLQQPNSLRKEVVTLKALLHLSAARSEISEIFLGTSAEARMQIISQDRELIRQRDQLSQKSAHTGGPRRKSCLSAATQKSLERKRERLRAAIKSKGAARGELYANCASSPRLIL